MLSKPISICVKQEVSRTECIDTNLCAVKQLFAATFLILIAT